MIALILLGGEVEQQFGKTRYLITIAYPAPGQPLSVAVGSLAQSFCSIGVVLRAALEMAILQIIGQTLRKIAYHSLRLDREGRVS